MPSTSSIIQDLLGWAEEHGTVLHKSVEIYHDQVTGFSFRATQDIPSGTKLVKCSYGTTLSYLNTITPTRPYQVPIPHPGQLPAQFIDNLKQDDPNIIGHFFLMQQYLMGEKSPWWHYIRFLPQPDNPEMMRNPAWWPESDRNFLSGTNAEPPLKERIELWKKEWEKGIFFLRGQIDNSEAYTYLLYQWAATIFGTRSFRASLTIPEDMATKSFWDESLNLDHMRKDMFSILFPVLDIGNHNGINQVDWSRNQTSRLFSLSSRVRIQKGSQIFNYYGKKSNSELLVGYGFILQNPNNDSVNLKLTPEPNALLLRRSQSCHGITDANQPEQELVFSLRIASSVPQIFSHGLIDSMSCIVANRAERNFILENPGFCIEDHAAEAGNPLSRTYFHALSILRDKLEYEILKIQQFGAKLG